MINNGNSIIKSCKVVTFDTKPPIVKTMITWNYAYRAARHGPWEEAARDRERFQRRINQTAKIVEPILMKQLQCYLFRNDK